MAINRILRKGMSGEDVLSIQKSLNKAGANLVEDGVFGDKTLAAVKNYQKTNNLAVDGIVGTNTWASLNGSNTSASTNSNKTTTKKKTAAELAAEKVLSNDSLRSDAVTKSAALDTIKGQEPGAFTHDSTAKKDEYRSKIENRDPFKYNVRADMLYQQYEDVYLTQGMMAMMDAIGQAAALSGGYTNSYAQGVGQQTYQNYVQQLNNKIPELYQLAYDKYSQEGDELLNMYNLYAGEEADAYSKYMDSYNIWKNKRDTASSEYQAALDRLYQSNRDAIEDERYKNEWDYKVEQDQKEASKGGSGSSKKINLDDDEGKDKNTKDKAEPAEVEVNMGMKMFMNALDKGALYSYSNYTKDGKNVDDYTDYILRMLNTGHYGNLTNEEVQYLIDYATSR